jgi:hypothetical protein
VSLSHKEWKFITSHLSLYPVCLSEYLLNGSAHDQSIESVLVDFLECLLSNHPLSGKIRVCNKLLPLLQFCSGTVHSHIQSKSKLLQGKISAKRDAVYAKILSEVNISEMEHQIQALSATHSKPHANNQVSLTGCPLWYNTDQTVALYIIAELLMGCSIVIDLSQIYSMVYQTIHKVNPSPFQSQITGRLTSTFDANYIQLY